MPDELSQTGSSESIQFFAKREKLFPKAVNGRYRKLRWAAMFVLLGIYYLAPFLRWDRGPHAPDQAILIDMANRRGYFFFLEIWPQEVYYLTGILILSAVLLFFITSLFGRVWCGYACPQTVWTDLYIKVEQWIQGDRAQRMKLEQAPWSLTKLWKKGATHVLWLLIALFTGGAWVLYFNDAPTLLEQIIHAELGWGVGGWIVGLTFSTYLMAGFAREQVCIYMCPYSRFQSAMFDEDTLLISYDEQRGETRGSHKKGESWEGRGHCVDCKACVHVCPMGIDIRNGLQYQCIACGLCVDACNGIMEKLGLPKGLVRYDTMRNVKQRLAGLPEKLRILRPRTIYYSLIVAIVGGIMLTTLLQRSVVDMNVIHDRNPLLVKLADGRIRNGYSLTVMNKTFDDQQYKLVVKGLDGAEVKLQTSGAEVEADNVRVFANNVGHFRLFVSAPEQNEDRLEFTLHLENLATGDAKEENTVFMSRK